MSKEQFSKGDRVVYDNGHKTEVGIVKSIAADGDLFIVYHCGGNWHRYQDYTAAKTPRRYVQKLDWQ